MSPVHNHGPTEGRGLDCGEQIIDGQLTGWCLRDATAAPPAPPQPARQGQDSHDTPDAAAGRLAPGTPEWGDWVQRLINDTSASAEDLERYFDTPPSARQHDHQEERP